MLKFYRLNKGKKLFSFDDPILSVPIGNLTLKESQNIAITKNGHVVVDIENTDQINEKEYFVFDEDLFFTSDFIKQAITLSKSSSSSLQFGMGANTFNERFVLPPASENKYNFYYQNGSEIELVNISQTVYEHNFMVPKQIVKAGSINYDQCETFISRVASPFHLLHINLAVNLNRTIKLQKCVPKWIQEKFIPDGSKLFHIGLRRLNKIGKNCKIHKSAVIEGSIIGDNVIIGPNSVVTLSQIGEGSVLEDKVSICNSVIGKKNYISSGNTINLCMSYNDVFLIHGPYQFSIFGNNVATMAVINCDLRLDQKNIMIPTDVGLLDSNQPLLGIAYGHNVVVGGGNIIAPGRIVPNDRKINPPESIIITKFD